MDENKLHASYRIFTSTLRVGAYLRWALTRRWALIKLSTFSASVVCLFCNKTINGNNKTQRCNKKQSFYKILWRKLLLREVSYYYLFNFFKVGGGKGLGWVWHLFKAGRLLTFSALRMGAYSNKYGNCKLRYV